MLWEHEIAGSNPASPTTSENGGILRSRVRFLQPMIQATATPTSPPSPAPVAETPLDYQPGVCNIGPAEIARAVGPGTSASSIAIGLFAGLVRVDAPPPARLLVALPAIAAASGYLQARFQFCAGFGSRGVYNFGEVGPMIAGRRSGGAGPRSSAARDQIGFASVAIGVAVGVIAAVALPI